MLVLEVDIVKGPPFIESARSGAELLVYKTDLITAVCHPAWV